jgi:hypothetical protein
VAATTVLRAAEAEHAPQASSCLVRGVMTSLSPAYSDSAISDDVPALAIPANTRRTSTISLAIRTWMENQSVGWCGNVEQVLAARNAKTLSASALSDWEREHDRREPSLYHGA